MTETLKRTPLYDIHVRNGGRMVPFAGWEMPVQFSGIKAEHQAVRTQAGLFDVSHMGEFRFRGPDALAFLNRLLTNDVSRLGDGEALYSPMCNADGGIVDDLLVHRFGPTDYLLAVNAGCRDNDLAHIQSVRSGDGVFTDESDDTGQVALQGPMSVDILRQLPGGADFIDLPYFAFRQGALLGVPCWVARTGYTAEDGFEVYCPSEATPQIFEALMAAGAPMGMLPVGLGARDTLRLEGRMMLYGNELSTAITPLEVGLAWTVKLDKDSDFIGKDALLRQKEAGVPRKLIGFEMVDRAIARHGYPVVDINAPEREIGTVTSGSPSPTLGKNIGLALVPQGRYRIGETLGIRIRDQVKLAQVVRTPFYNRPR